jgi:hypothetical protein
MGIVKLQQAGESVTWQVKSAEVVEGKFGPQIKFEDAASGDLLYISQDTAVRQLSRIPLEVEACAGETLTFSRDPNKSGGAPYWGIRVADAVERSQPVQSKRLAPPPNDPLPFDLPVDEGHGADPVAHLPPRVTGEGQRVAPNAAKRAALVDEYLALMAHVRKHSGLSDEQAIQAATFSVFKMWKDAGLVG